METGLYGHRVSVRIGDPLKFELPPYIADLVVSKTSIPAAELKRIANSVRPFGGRLVAPQMEPNELPGFRAEAIGEGVMRTRDWLPGSTNYTGDWKANADALVRAPVGVLWFDDTLGHFKRSPQPRIVDGVMITADKKWLDASTRADKADYLLNPAVFSDVYTGRILADDELPMLSASACCPRRAPWCSNTVACLMTGWKPGLTRGRCDRCSIPPVCRSGVRTARS